jgi:hypothetical protein
MSALEDHRAIVDLTIAYCWALDTRSWDDLDQVFAPSATADLGGSYSGIEAIKQRVSSVLTPLDASQHTVSTHQVHIDGERATCRCYLQAQHVDREAEGGSTLMVGGHYRDTLALTAAGWRITDRVLTITWTDGNPAILGL